MATLTHSLSELQLKIQTKVYSAKDDFKIIKTFNYNQHQSTINKFCQVYTKSNVLAHQNAWCKSKSKIVIPPKIIDFLKPFLN